MPDCDVLVVGAGLAGLTCANTLHRDGYAVTVVEARGRVGGRVHSADLGGHVIELGGQYLGPGQNRAYALAAELGLSTYPAHKAGDHLVEASNGRVRRYRGTIPRLAPTALLDVAQAQRRFERLVQCVNTEAPWATPGAEELDRQSLATWIHRSMWTRDGRRLFALACGAVWSAEPQDISLLHALVYAKAAGSLRVLLASEGGAQQDRIDGGAHALAAGLANRLGNAVDLEMPVVRINHSDNDVEIVTRDGTRRGARHVVVALPPPLAGRIEYDPPLPGLRDALTQRLPMGGVVKCMAVYETPFWRERGLSGRALTMRGPMSAVFDSSSITGTPGILLAFVEGDAARRHNQGAREGRADVLAALGRFFGPRALHPAHYLEQDWTLEPYSRGGYSATFPPGAWTGFGHTLRPSIGRIHWSGTETATRWYGYIEGAIRSGEDTAARIVNTVARDAA